MILAIDTAGPWVQVAIGPAGGGTPLARRRPAALNHNEELVGMVDELLECAGVERPTAIAVDVGPGSFTGTRVGVAFAVGAAQGWGLPLFAASSFQVAATLAPDGTDKIAVALPVVRGSWCRAHLTLKGGSWSEQSLVELETEEVPRGLGETPLVVPWGTMTGAVAPGDDWNAAAALWSLAAAPGAVFSAPDEVNVRYVGPSQAERKFDAGRGAC
jgi:tRNA threonylcarbamoyl adenosine modification protein YeaZ